MRKRTSKIWALSKKDFLHLCENGKSIADCLRKLGMQGAGGNVKTFSKRIEEEGVDISHFNTEKTFNKKVIPLSIIMVEGSKHSRASLKRKLLKDNIIENKCSICGLLPEWNGKPLVLRLDHINGVRDDNRLENLRMVCPNCDSQLETFGSRNRSKKLPNRVCSECGIPILKHSSRCRKCSSIINGSILKKFNIDKEELQHLIKTTSMVQIGRMFGVSDNTVRKRCKRLKII